jgi:hypothetical protein
MDLADRESHCDVLLKRGSLPCTVEDRVNAMYS